MIDVTITINGENHHLVVNQPAGGGGYHVMLDGYYQGCISYNTKGWVPYLHENTILPERYVNRIVERIREVDKSN